jgi:hypothetical protein
MKIGILTLPLNYNYGGILQTYALQKVLKRMGNDVKLINMPFHRKNVTLKSKTKRVISKMLGRYKGYICYEEKSNHWLPFMMAQTNKFVEKYIERTNEISSYTDLKPTDFDAIVVGSDQVWRPGMFQNDISLAYLRFSQSWNIRRISYAASFGTDLWEYTPEQTRVCSALAKHFDAIAVREKGGVVLCKEQLGIDAQLVCDPTLLLDKEDYIRLIDESGMPQSVGNLFDYMLDVTPEKKELVAYISRDRNLQSFRINSLDNNIKNSMESYIAQPVEAWIRGFYDAEFVVTDSFHGCVFAIIFRKPFAVVGNRERGLARFESLLGTLGLTDRMILNIDDYKNLHTAIDYDAVYEKLNAFRESSNKYLSDCITL